MKRLLLLATALVLLLTACAAPAASVPDAPAVPDASAPPAEAAETAVTFTDDLGRTVTADRPERVAALIGSFADIWCLAGGKDVLVVAAGDTWTSFD